MIGGDAYDNLCRKAFRRERRLKGGLSLQAKSDPTDARRRQNMGSRTIYKKRFRSCRGGMWARSRRGRPSVVAVIERVRSACRGGTHRTYRWQPLSNTWSRHRRERLARESMDRERHPGTTARRVF